MNQSQQKFGELVGLISRPQGKSTGVLVLLHGVGSNEKDLFSVSPLLTVDRTVISLRAPIQMGQDAHAWFHVQFTEQGPVHNWAEAKQSLVLLENALRAISEETETPLNQISVFGFSQGAIMTIGLALTSDLNLESYVPASGRTLPEFAQAGIEKPKADFQKRRVFVSHGVKDNKLPVQLGRNTQAVLGSLNFDLMYREYEVGHTVSSELVTDARLYLANR